MITFTVTLSMGFPFIWAVADGTRDIKAFLLSALVGAVMSGVLALAGRPAAWARARPSPASRSRG